MADRDVGWQRSAPQNVHSTNASRATSEEQFFMVQVGSISKRQITTRSSSLLEATFRLAISVAKVMAASERETDIIKKEFFFGDKKRQEGEQA